MSEEYIIPMLGAKRTMMLKARLFPQLRPISKLSDGPANALQSIYSLS